MQSTCALRIVRLKVSLITALNFERINPNTERWKFITYFQIIANVLLLAFTLCKHFVIYSKTKSFTTELKHSNKHKNSNSIGITKKISCMEPQNQPVIAWTCPWSLCGALWHAWRARPTPQWPDPVGPRVSACCTRNCWWGSRSRVWTLGLGRVRSYSRRPSSPARWRRRTCSSSILCSIWNASSEPRDALWRSCCSNRSWLYVFQLLNMYITWNTTKS